MNIHTIDKHRVSDQVFEQICRMIASGEWKSGDKLPSENELTERFGVSRTTVREALKKLVSYNIIETSQGRGSYIRETDDVSLFEPIMLSVLVNGAEESTIRDMMEFRRIVEVESVYLAVQRASESEVRDLRENYKAMVNAKENIHLFARYDLEFHKRIAEMTQNAVLIKCYSVIWDFLREYFDKVVETIGVEKGVFYHGKIVDSMEKRNADEACRWMKEHLQVTSEGALKKRKANAEE